MTAGSTMQIKAVIFDIDGTLLDSNEQHIIAWQKAFATIGASIEAHAIHDQMGKGADMLIPALMPELDQATKTKVDKAQASIFKETFIENIRPFRQARELLVHVVKRGQKVVLASSASEAELDHYLDLLEARELVTSATHGDEVEHTKPAPDIFAAALGKLPGIGPQEVIVVGDTPYDIEAAKKCGISGVAVRSGDFSDEVLRRAGAISIYDDVAALLWEYSTSPLAR